MIRQTRSNPYQKLQFVDILRHQLILGDFYANFPVWKTEQTSFSGLLFRFFS